MTGTIWLGLSQCGIPAASSRRAQQRDAVLMRGAFGGLSFRCRMLASAPAATAGGSAVVKMKPDAKLRTKSHNAAEPAM